MLRRRREPFRPTAVVDFDLGWPHDPHVDVESHPAVRALVRLFGVPVGYVDVESAGAAPLPIRITDAALARHGEGLLRCAVRHALDAALADPAALSERILQPPPRSGITAATAEKVTVAVCTRDRPADLRRCLEALLRLDWPALDLLVVDNAPATDASCRLVEESFPAVRYVREPRPGLNWARNRAIVEARGDIIAYADDDVVVDPDWVRAVVAVFADDPDAVAVTGLVAPCELETEAQAAFEDHRGFHTGFSRTWNRVDLEAGERVALAQGAVGEFGNGANMAYRRRFFTQTGGFDPALDVGTPTLGGGDLEMFFRVLKAGHTLVREPRAVVFHRNRRTSGELRAQISTWGVGMYSYMLRSCIAYPDERAGFAMLAARWLLLRNPRRVLRSLVRPQFRLELLWDEMKLSLLAPTRYRRARRRAAEIIAEFGPPALDGTPGVEASQTVPAVRRPRASRRVDLSEPPHALTDTGDAGMVDVLVSWGGTDVGSVALRSCGRPLGAARIRDAIADGLWPEILRRSGLDTAGVMNRMAEPRTQECDA
jgi:O-antigen biosynthesis protein